MAGATHPRFRYRRTRGATLPILTTVTNWQTSRVLAGSTACACPVIVNRRLRVAAPHRRPVKWPISLNSWLFCRQRLHVKLDNHRRRWKNTLELIILPVSGRFYRPTWLPAWPFAGCLLLARGSGNSQQRIRNAVRRDKGHLNALRIVLGKRYPSEPWLWVFVFRFDPDQVSAADLRYTSAE
jgi:hypothetical protein